MYIFNIMSNIYNIKMTKKCSQKKCSPQKIPMTVEIQPHIQLCVDKPHVKVKNNAECKCKHDCKHKKHSHKHHKHHKHNKKHHHKHHRKHNKKHKTNSSSSSSDSGSDWSSGDHMF
jgi:hypothetical protein